MDDVIPCWECNKQFLTHLDYDIHAMSVLHHYRLEQMGHSWHTCALCDFSCTKMAEYVEHSKTDLHLFNVDKLRGVRVDITDDDDPRKRQIRVREITMGMPPGRKRDFVFRGSPMNTRANSNKSNKSDPPGGVNTPTNTTSRASTPKRSTAPTLPRGETAAQKRARSKPGPKPTSAQSAAAEKSSEPPAKKTPAAKKSPIKKPPVAQKKNWEKPITRNEIASRNLARYSTRRRQAYVRVDPVQCPSFRNSSTDEASSSCASPTPMHVRATNTSARSATPFRPAMQTASPRNIIASGPCTPAPSRPADLARHQEEELSTTLNTIQSIRQPVVSPLAAVQQQTSTARQQMPTVPQPSAPVPRQTPAAAVIPHAPVLSSFPPAPVQRPPPAPAAQQPPAQLPAAPFVPASGSMGTPMGNRPPQPSSTSSSTVSEAPVLLSIGAMARRIKQEHDRDIIAIPGPLERQLEIGRLTIEEERLKRTLDAKKAELPKLVEKCAAFDNKWIKLSKDTTINVPQNVADDCFRELMEFFRTRTALNEKTAECDKIEADIKELREKKEGIVTAFDSNSLEPQGLE